MRILYWLQEYQQLHEGSIDYGCDGQSALQACFENKGGPRTNHFDLIDGVKGMHKKLHLYVKWKWVRGHQDQRGLGPLDLMAHLNILADAFDNCIIVDEVNQV